MLEVLQGNHLLMMLYILLSVLQDRCNLTGPTINLVRGSIHNFETSSKGEGGAGNCSESLQDHRHLINYLRPRNPLGIPRTFENTIFIKYYSLGKGNFKQV